MDSEGVLPTFRQDEYLWMRMKLPIDRMRIDDEVIEISGLVERAGEYTALATEIQEAAELDLKITSAIVCEQLRKQKKDNGKYLSETQVQSESYLDQRVVDKQEALSKARLDARLWSTLIEALRRKDSAIRTVVELINAGLISSSSIIAKRRQEIRNANKQEVS